jgi:tRNA modification GTPase
VNGRGRNGHGAPETIVAAATAPGRAALAIVRISGPAAREILRAVFRRSRSSAPLPVRRPVVGQVIDRSGQVIDQGTLVLYAAPRSYTGEDLAELTLHGSPAIVREVVTACAGAGARPARPGEFTLRALQNGKVTLDRAEAIGDLVEAATLEQARVAARQLGGEVGEAVVPIAAGILDLLADAEAALDFVEDERHLATSNEELAGRCEDLARRIETLLAAGTAAWRVRDGARVVLLGPPNAGKSSLFNALVGSARVIVTEEPGTTRDLVEETIVIEGMPVVLVDAAGIGAARGVAEEEAEKRAVAAAERADLVLEVYDLAAEMRPPGLPSRRRARVGTHADLPPSAPPAQGSVLVSSTTGQGIAELRERIAAALEAPGQRPLESVALATDRHREAAGRAREDLLRAREALLDGPGADAAAAELRNAGRALAEILGEIDPEELLGRIFSRFCIGK